LLPEVLERLKSYDWLGNVRQLENACRWLTVMAPGRDIHLQDLPPELRQPGGAAPAAETALPVSDTAAAGTAPAAAALNGSSWHAALAHWAETKLAAGESDLLGEASPLFERTLIKVALAACKGQRQEAARRLGWGRNTLTRKIKELGIED
jgi:two-component system nitrogen regulation response regulator GlnG